MQKCDSQGSVLRHQAVSLLGIKGLLTCQGEMRLWGEMIWMGPQWMDKPWSMLKTGGTFFMLVKFFFDVLGFCLFVCFETGFLH